ncbi:hypothetical protein CDAR_527331 [Caerostris darwini]|uniref:Uncharacterized protein n=1 Tax=Caerostris darwini TaxID=1538125 RepID=A0AAV4WL08_9ARAC|nr:hypothetical protein CDAR_527331 [Caerostris darwini]
MYFVYVFYRERVLKCIEIPYPKVSVWHISSEDRQAHIFVVQPDNKNGTRGEVPLPVLSAKGKTSVWKVFRAHRSEGERSTLAYLYPSKGVNCMSLERRRINKSCVAPSI